MSIRQIIIFLGAPGSGKGALSRRCVDTFGWKQLSTGDLCRKHRSEGTELGKQIDFALKSGTLVSDEVIIDIVAQWIDQEVKDAEAVILDGFPRTVAQAQGFLAFLSEKLSGVKLVIAELRVSDVEVIERMSSRLVCINKSCQAVYSNRSTKFKAKEHGVCDMCGSPLAQRDDDRPEAISMRLATYHQHREALTSFYKDAGYSVYVIDGNRGSEEVFDDFLKHVGKNDLHKK